MLPGTDLLEAMGKFNEELFDAGILLSADGLKPSSEGKRVAFDGADRAVIDGPFAETRELVAGFWLWQVKDMTEARERVKQCPNPMLGPSVIEIRPLYEIADFGEAMTPELAAQEECLRKETDLARSQRVARRNCCSRRKMKRPALIMMAAPAMVSGPMTSPKKR